MGAPELKLVRDEIRRGGGRSGLGEIEGIVGGGKGDSRGRRRSMKGFMIEGGTDGPGRGCYGQTLCTG